jgi:hypothetical protein
MNKIKFLSKLLLIFTALTLSLSSCKKNNLTDDAESSAAQNLNIADIEDDNLQIMADQAAADVDISLRTSNIDNSAVDLITGCATVTKDTLSTPKKITIDFGTGCTNANGVTRKGKLLITYTGAYRATGTTITINTDGYYVNENKVDINKTIYNTGLNDNGNIVYQIQSTRTVTFPDGITTRSTTANKTREWLEGASTPTVFADDVYRIIGTATHTSKRGILYDVTTITPLIRKVVCHQFVSGEVKIVRNGNTTRFGFINFGNGDCDDTATVTLDNGRIFNISLRH